MLKHLKKMPKFLPKEYQNMHEKCQKKILVTLNVKTPKIE